MSATPSWLCKRYAVYLLPGALSPDPVRTLAESWLGRSVDGRFVDPAVPSGWTREQVDAITVDARRYGFHATLRAPFRLADDVTTGDLETRVSDLARHTASTTMPRLELVLLDGFYALVPGAPATGLDALAASVVRNTDDLRAPLTEAERARRRPERLTAAQRGLLDLWGYPYVLDEFRAHLTLTDHIAEVDRPRVGAALAEHFDGYLSGGFAGFGSRDVQVDALCVYSEPEPGAPFVLRSVHQLEGRTTLPDRAQPARPVMAHNADRGPVGASV
ncbi:MAG: DUF1045 domain-containing protein [Micrococcales bacterium]|nr:DUF1045 domain-containing protein [Micrococcales bacterium]MCL2667917.1 DUF1045 domain-containing protein [Micrococcales bacterium]